MTSDESTAIETTDNPSGEVENTDDDEINGPVEPIHRSNSLHPITGKQDRTRARIGDRRRIETLEFKLGRIICGSRSNITGEYCIEPPIPGSMRCAKHQAINPRYDAPNPKYTMVSHVFQRCNLCRILECPDRNTQSGANECVIERDLFESLQTQATELDNYGEATKHMFEQLIWTRVLLYRAFAQMAAEGLTVVETTGFSTDLEGAISPITNDREHPILKHIARLLQADKQIADALELTPAARTRKGESDSSKDAHMTLAGLFKKSLQKFKEQ